MVASEFQGRAQQKRIIRQDEGQRQRQRPRREVGETSQVEMDIPQGQEEGEDGEQAKKKLASRIIGIVLLAFIACLFWIYGFGSEYRPVTSNSNPVSTTNQSMFNYLFIITAMFAILGFGLLFMFLKKLNQSTIFISIFIVSLTLLVSPVFQKFWYNAFLNGFGNNTNNSQAHDYLLNQSMGGNLIFLDLYNLRFSLLCAVSQLVVLLGVFGRINFVQLIIFSLTYDIAWSLNNYAVFNIQGKSPDSRFYDDFQISTVYLFAACFGIFASVFLKKPPIDSSYEHSNFSSMFALLGSFFIFFTFSGTSALFSMKTSPANSVRNYVWMEAILSTFFALSANVLSTAVITVALQGKFMIRWQVFSVIAGGIVFGTAAQISLNIGAAIGCGSGAGILTILYFHIIQPRINRRRVIDSFGIILFFVVSIFSTLVVSTYILRVYYSNGVIIPALATSSSPAGEAIPNRQVSGYGLTYPACSMLIGAISGLLLCLFLRCFDDVDAEQQKIMSDKMFISTAHGLRPQKQKKKRRRYTTQQDNPIPRQTAISAHRPIQSSGKLQIVVESNESKQRQLRQTPEKMNNPN